MRDLVRWAIGILGGRAEGGSSTCVAAGGICGGGWTATLGGVSAANVSLRGVTDVVVCNGGR